MQTMFNSDQWTPSVADNKEEQPMNDVKISEAEVSFIRWIEKLGTPLLITAVIAVAAFGVDIRDTVAQLAGEHDRYNEINGSINAKISQISQKIDQQNRLQQQLELSVKRIETRQEGYKEQIDDIKTQNAEILRLIRGQDTRDRNN